MEQKGPAKSEQELRNLMLEVARTQLAATTAALKFWGGWVETADKYAQKVSAELARVGEGTDDSDRFMGRLTDSSREYLREMSNLPKVAADYFASEMEKITKAARQPASGRRRNARAKE
jgi:hypothetical protein